MGEGLPRGWYVEGIEDPKEVDAIRRQEAEDGVLPGEKLYALLTSSSDVTDPVVPQE